MKVINSLPEVKEEIARLAAAAEDFRASTEALQRFFDGLLGSTSPSAKPSSQSAAPKMARGPSTVHLYDGGFRAAQESQAPPTVIERVLTIMRDIGEPVLPKEIARHYLLRDWPLPKKGTIYNLVSGTVTYLYLRKGVLKRGPKGYSLPHGDIAKLMSASPKIKGEGVRAKKRAEKKLSVEPLLPLSEVPPPDDFQQPVAL